MAERMTGGCQCGRIRYSVAIDSDEAYLCHCRMCQRATGGVAAALKEVPESAVTWHHEPDQFQSSPIARRGFCARCGTPISFSYVKSSGYIDLTVGSFDDPGYFRPTSQFGTESMHRAWVDTSALPEHRSDTHKPLVERWMKAVGKLPN